MRKIPWISIIVAMLILVPFGRRAEATTNLFTPVSGTGFIGDIVPPSNYISHAYGSVFSTNPGTQELVEASLGHAAGGTNGFYIYGVGNGQTLHCVAEAQPSGNPSIYYPFPNDITPASGAAFSMFIETNLASGDYFYSMFCDLPPENFATHLPMYVFGVKPDH